MTRSRRVLKLDGDALSILSNYMIKFCDSMENDLSALTLHIDELTTPEIWEANAVVNFKEKFEGIKKKEKDLLEDMRNLRQELDREYMDWWATSQDFFARPDYSGFHLKG